MRLLIAGGGTGGHLFPGVAIAEELRARDPDAPIQFVGTKRGIEARVLPELGWDLALIEVSGLKTVGVLGAIRGLFRIPRAMWQSRKVIKAFNPDVVIGVGGYASGPVVLMARLMGKPTAVLEQNSIPGLANKILGKFVHSVFLCFDESRRFFKANKIHMTGNPIRVAIRTALADAATEADGNAAGEQSEGLRLFVFGGSQGAVAVNEVASQAAALVDKGIIASIVHQSGERDLEATMKRYEQAGIKADVRAFINDMAREYAASDLVISRAGATTVAELGVVGLPAILVPYPHAADNHQEINAREMVDAGAALMFRQAELTPERLAESLTELAKNRAALRRMGSAMKALGRPRAAADILDWCADRAGSSREGK